jgi:hypothetical protein
MLTPIFFQLIHSYSKKYAKKRHCDSENMLSEMSTVLTQLYLNKRDHYANISKCFIINIPYQNSSVSFPSEYRPTES